MRWALAVLLAACGSGTVTARSFPAEFARAVCEVQARCREQARSLEQECEQEAASLYGDDLGKALAAGRSRFDAAAAQSCIDGLRARGCERTLPEVDAACERAVVGTLASGANCDWLYECATGRCVPEGPGACPAKCGPVGGEGAPCSAAPCDLRAGLRCIGNVCSKLHLAGEACFSTSDCALEFFCDNAGTCAARGAEQAVCERDEQCARGLFCDAADQGGLCRAKLGNGASCTAASLQSVRGACEDGSLCKGFRLGAAAGTCTPAGDIGAACVAGADVTGCAEGLVCSGATCAEKPVSGPCAQDDDCRDGAAYCDGAQCQPVKPVGAPCTRGPECESGFCDGASGLCAEGDFACHEP